MSATAAADRFAHTPVDLVGRLVEEVMNGNQTNILDELCTPPLARKLTMALAQFRAAFPDWHQQLLETVTDGRTVVARMRYTGTHRGTWLGLRPTGRTMRVDEVYFFRTSDDRINGLWGIEDTWIRLRQLAGDDATLGELGSLSEPGTRHRHPPCENHDGKDPMPPHETFDSTAALQKFRDDHAVVDALYRFAAGQDLKDPVLFRSAFALRATLDFTQPAQRFGANIPVMPSRDAIDQILTTLEPLVTSHTVTNPRVLSTVTGPPSPLSSRPSTSPRTIPATTSCSRTSTT